MERIENYISKNKFDILKGLVSSLTGIELNNPEPPETETRQFDKHIPKLWMVSKLANHKLNNLVARKFQFARKILTPDFFSVYDLLGL